MKLWEMSPEAGCGRARERNPDNRTRTLPLFLFFFPPSRSLLVWIITVILKWHKSYFNRLDWSKNGGFETCSSYFRPQMKIHFGFFFVQFVSVFLPLHSHFPVNTDSRGTFSLSKAKYFWPGAPSLSQLFFFIKISQNNEKIHLFLLLLLLLKPCLVKR